MHAAQPFTQFINVPCYLVDPYIHDTYTRILLPIIIARAFLFDQTSCLEFNSRTNCGFDSEFSYHGTYGVVF